MIYHFKCNSCSFVQEVIRPANGMTFEDRDCPRCGKKKTSEHQFEGAPAVATSGMSQAPIDVVVGRDAAARWEDIGKRQALRNKARAAAGLKEGDGAVRMTGRNQFEALPDAKKVFVETKFSSEDKE